jgi:hypothetical protein
MAGIRYWTNACQSCAIKHSCTTGKERRIARWEHEHILEAVQRRLDEHPEKKRQRRETVEHPFGTIKARMGATHFLMRTLPRVASEMALHMLAYNLTRVMNIMGIHCSLPCIGERLRLSVAVCGLACVTLPTIACPPSLTDTCCTVTFCSPPVR